MLDAQVKPIRNPVTGEPYHIAIQPHDGFEFRSAEMASATFWSNGELAQRHTNRFAAISCASYSPHGIISEDSLPARRGWCHIAKIRYSWIAGHPHLAQSSRAARLNKYQDWPGRL